MYGDTTDPALTVALAGDSVAGNWFPALQNIASSHGCWPAAPLSRADAYSSGTLGSAVGSARWTRARCAAGRNG